MFWSVSAAWDSDSLSLGRTVLVLQKVAGQRCQAILHMLLWWFLHPAAALPGAGSASTLNSAPPRRNHLPPLHPDTGIVWMRYQQMAGIQDYFFLIFFFKWSGTQMALFLLSQSLTEMWTQTCLNWEAQPRSMFRKSCRNYCTDQFSLNQSHTWQRFPCPAFIWMGGFVPLVPTSPHLMPVTNTFPEVQQAAPQKLCATVSNTHATLGEILTVSFKKYCICSLPPPHARCCLRAHKTSQILRFSQPPPTPVAPSPPGHRGGGTWPITSHWAVASCGMDWKRPTALIPAGATNWRKSDTFWLQFIDNKPLTVLN